MIRLNVVVEGQTEETFVRDLLTPHMADFDVVVTARLVGHTKRGVRHKGGLRSYAAVKGDLQRWLKQDANPEVRLTTMFDLYALPSDFPGYVSSQQKPDYRRRVTHLEQCFAQDLGDRRFIPYLQLHEFEALLLADPAKLGVFYPEAGKAIRSLTEAVAGFDSPEQIDDGPQTAPSKRIGAVIPRYPKMKTTVGPQVAAKIGLDTLRRKCPHFREWLSKLEGLSGRSAAGAPALPI